VREYISIKLQEKALAISQFTFGLGSYIESRLEFAATISAIREPRTTTGGVNFVIGFRPELWRDIVPEDAPCGPGRF
jgi:hypothetical protein